MVPAEDRATLQGFVREVTEPGSTVYTDEARAYKGIDRHHETVNHSAGEYVREMATTNGVESFWSEVKRGYVGTYFHFSEKHMDRYIAEFSGRHNMRARDTEDQMALIVGGLVGRRLTYRELISEKREAT